MVLVSDDGDGVLGAGDSVLHSWLRPPEIVPVDQAVDLETTTLELLRPAEPEH